MNGNRITLKDVAEACGYTVNTVSRALRDDPRLPPATRTKIRQTAVTMGYIRNSLASTLRSGKAGMSRLSSTIYITCIFAICSAKWTSNCAGPVII